MGEQGIPIAVPDLRQREKDAQFRQRAIQEKLETLSCAIYVQAVATLLAEAKASLEPELVAKLGVASIDASLAMGKCLYGITAVRAEVVPPVREAADPF
jgi:hypothetical protein